MLLNTVMVSLLPQDAIGSSEVGNWAVVLTAVGSQGLTKCIGSQDVDDPTEVPEARWSCESHLIKMLYPQLIVSV